MGQEIEDTHEKRSSSMSFALRWKHGNMRLISVVSMISFAAIFMFMMLLYGTALKHVTVVMDGQETEVWTSQWVTERFLDEQAIALGEHDRLSIPLDAKIRDGERIIIQRAKAMEVTVDGETKTIYTVAKYIDSALQDAKIEIGSEDKLSLAMDFPVEEGAKLQIIRVDKQLEEIIEPIVFNVVKQSDPQLLKGKETVVQDGQEGALLKKIEKVYEDGELVSEHVIAELVQSESVSKIVAVGTKNPVVALSASSPAIGAVTMGGITFDAKQILNNVTLTAYTAGPESTGKTEDHPQYGITRSGTRVMEGRTVAVDPKVIPLGWWVYIDGIGFRRAEDTGGAVKGNKIDVYFESSSYAKKFGLKRGYTVYVIGPKKPTED